MKDSEPTYIDEVDAKGGRRVKGMPYVLSISLVAIIIGSVIALAAFFS
jgi:hypothetical protein